MQITVELIKEKQYIALLALILFGFFASGFNLEMSFSSQAPEGNWNEPWYNDCEEVSIVMVDSYYNNRILTPAIAKKEILRMFEIKEKAFGPSLEEDSDQNVSFINNYLNSNWKAEVAENPTIEDIKDEINNGHPVILPVDGRILDNRYFTTSHYHVFVISGYDDGKKMFITQEPGTYRGHDYQYSYEVIEEAMHDYNPHDMSMGRRVAIFTSPEIIEPEKIASGQNDIEKMEAPKATVIPSPALIITNNEVVKNNDLPAVSEKNVEGRGLINTIKNYWIRMIEWIKKIF